MTSYRIQYGTGFPGDPWNTMSEPFRSFDKAMAWLRHLSRCNQIDAYRIVDGEGRWIVAVIPGEGGAA